MLKGQTVIWKARDAAAVLLPAAASSERDFQASPTGNTGNNVERTNGIRVKATQEQLDKEARYKFFTKEVWKLCCNTGNNVQSNLNLCHR